MWPGVSWPALFLVFNLVQCAHRSRIVETRQGPIQGIVLEPAAPRLGRVEAFLGVPYAGPPVGKLRFMPPSTPQSWKAVRQAGEFGPVCPQIIPQLQDEAEALRFMTLGRLNYLRKLLRLLENQSEDCLYLNIYSPEAGRRHQSRRLPVIVFIHGESYEWNSGNPYDGSVLSSYGQVVVVTLNYRLGILGFLRTGLQENVVGNFGLLDLIGALHWIKENIGAFGGDPGSVTMMGHGTGAALVGFLLVSPVTQGGSQLFHKAILMSGSSLAGSSLARDPYDVTRQVAAHTNCPLNGLSECLKDIDVQKLLNIDIKSSSTYSTPLGPYVDGIIIPDYPLTLIETYHDRFSKYDLMFGVTESEAFHLFPSFTLKFGISNQEKKDILRNLVSSEFDTYVRNIDQILSAVLNEYRDYKIVKEDNIVNRDMLLQIFSDCRAVAPVIKSAQLHSNNKKASYVYVFDHVSKNGYYPENFGSIHGEELAYVFGMPLVGGINHFAHNYTTEEKSLSELMMTFWVNFATAGNPGTRSIVNHQTDQYEQVSWPTYEINQQKHLVLGIIPKVGSHYRAHKMAVWNKLIPELVEKRGTDRGRNQNSEMPPFQTPWSPGQGFTTAIPPANFTHSPHSMDYLPKGKDHFEASNLPISVIVIVGLAFLVINLIACIGLYYQKQKIKKRELNLERKISRLSDAGIINDVLTSTKSANISSSSPQLNSASEIEEDGKYNVVKYGKTSQGKPIQNNGNGKNRSNSMKEVMDANSATASTTVLQSVLKKKNQSSETLVGNNSRRVLFPDQPNPKTRHSKSIPNINFKEDEDSTVGQVRRSASSSTVETDMRMGPDVLVMYNQKTEQPSVPEDAYSASKSTDSVPTSRKSSISASRKAFSEFRSAASSLIGSQRLRRQNSSRGPSPIIEFVPDTSPPDTVPHQQKPILSRPCSYGPSPEPIYVQRDHGSQIYSRTLPAGSSAMNFSPYGSASLHGITYPPYSTMMSGPPGPAFSTAAPFVSESPYNTVTTIAPSGATYPFVNVIRNFQRPQLTSPMHPAARLPRFQDPHFATLPTVRKAGHPGGPIIAGSVAGSPTGSLYSHGVPYDMVPRQMGPQPCPPCSDCSIGSLYPNLAQTSQGPPPNIPRQSINSLPRHPSSVCSLPKTSSCTQTPAFTSSESVPTTTTTASDEDRLNPDKGWTESDFQPPEPRAGAQKLIRQRQCKATEESDNDVKDSSDTGSNQGLKLGQKTPPGSLKHDRPRSSCKNWVSQFSQDFLSKTMDVPQEDLPPLGDEAPVEEENQKET